MGRWIQFARERFDPLSHSLMIALFVVAHYAAAAADLGLPGPSALVAGVWLPQVLLALGVTAFFFKLRLYDEIKDYELDCVINPTRPLARGLVTHADLYRGIVVCIAIELLTFGSRGPAALTAMSCAVLYSLLMYKEFFVRERIRPHLTTYALLHTIVCAMLSLAIFAALEGRVPWELGAGPWKFALACWFLFNVFEFGRKTFTTAEEREGVESYSKIFGRFGALVLTLSQGGAATWLLLTSPATAFPHLGPVLLGTTGLLALLGVVYGGLDRPPWGAAYRGMSSVYIILVFTAVVALGAAAVR